MEYIGNWIDGQSRNASKNNWLDKYNPHTGQIISKIANSDLLDIESVIESSEKSFLTWSQFTPIRRGQILFQIANAMRYRFEELSECVAIETGKSKKNAGSELTAAIQQAEYFSGEGMRLYGKSLTSGVTGKYSYTVRKPSGISLLIVPANTPIANIAWKVFPSLICGNSVILKASEDAPATALLFAKITKEAGLPDGVLNVIQGDGKISGAALVLSHKINVISFTGSTEVGKWIAEQSSKILTKISLELGGKNPFVVCDDADIDLAVHWAALSSFSNAGQRCAASSRILIFDSVFDEFKEKFVAKTKDLILGIKDECDLGPVISEKQEIKILQSIAKAESEGGHVLIGGKKSTQVDLERGYYIEPTIIDKVLRNSELSNNEIFGPVTFLYRVKDIHDALIFSNENQYGLTSAIHTKNIDRALWFSHRVRAGVSNINFGTFGSEPHMPFGGVGNSGNGTREPGVEALDVYSELKNISILADFEKI